MKWLIENDRYNLPNQMRPKCHHDDHTYLSMYGRLDWDEPAQTITTGFGSMGQGRYVHPSRPRTITPHEAARLQTFPDFFDFGEDTTRKTWAHVIGNAVPPLLGVHIGQPLLEGDGDASYGHPGRTAPSVDDEPASPLHRARSSASGCPPHVDATPSRNSHLRAELDRHDLAYEVDHSVDGTRRRVDIVFPPSKVAVYVDGCYWHGCPDHGTMPKANREWWEAKLAANRARDADTDSTLTAAGWAVLRFWEHHDPVSAAEEVARAVRNRRSVQTNGHSTARNGRRDPASPSHAAR